jgi:hypothetical protein
MARRKNQVGRNRRVQDVRIMDDYSGSDGAKFDRVLSSLQNSHSQTSLVVSDEFNIGVSTGNTNAILAGSQVRVMDDFASMAAQFQTFRIKRMRFDVYDVNPSLVTTAVWSTFHDVNTTSSQYVPTFSNVVDAPDSQVIPPGSGKVTFIWTAKGTEENVFQSTASTTPAPLDFGGLRYSIVGQPTTGSKFMVVVKAVVDFRGRD